MHAATIPRVSAVALVGGRPKHRSREGGSDLKPSSSFLLTKNTGMYDEVTRDAFGAVHVCIIITDVLHLLSVCEVICEGVLRQERLTPYNARQIK